MSDNRPGLGQALDRVLHDPELRAHWDDPSFSHAADGAAQEAFEDWERAHPVRCWWARLRRRSTGSRRR